MRFIVGVVAAFGLCLALSFPATVNAEDEFAEAEITIKPRDRATFFSNAFSAGEGTVNTAIRLPGPPAEYPDITPLKVSDLRFPPSNFLNFNPKPSMPVCPDDKLGPPPTSNSIEVPEMIARCPKALIGNGTAKFALARLTSPMSSRDGEVLIFNGGRVDGQPKIKIYAYSYDLTVGIYTSSVLEPSGRLRIEIPYLPVDSAVTEINLSIPGRKIVVPKPALDVTVTLPPGRDPDYLQVKCPGSAGLPWTTELTLGERDLLGNPSSPEFVVGDSGTNPCTGLPAAPRLAPLRVISSGQALRNDLATMKVRVSNTGGKAVTGARLLVSGRGVQASLAVGRIAGGQTRTVTVRTRFRARGLIKAEVKLRTGNAGSRVAVARVRVR